ncbi:MAG: permease prefix domain 1-containing protein [Bacteroidota bacterium]
METGKFDLDKSVADYVQLIQGRGSLTGSDAEELKGHLYDATEALTGNELTQEEAFIIARKRLGDKDMLHEEYSKVNTGIHVNKIWAYMFIGFNVLCIVPSFGILFLGVIELNLIAQFLPREIGGILITILHLTLCLGVVYLIKQKNGIAAFIEKRVQKNPVTTVAWSFLPVLIFWLVKVFVFKNNVQMLFQFQISKIGSNAAELSFYTLILTVIFGAIALVFSAGKTEKLTLKSLFEKPTTLFLILTGIVTEFAAACTRMIRFEDLLIPEYSIIPAAITFGLVYFIASVVISYYNRLNNFKYLVIFAALGLILETSVGISADMTRVEKYTPFFVSALIIGVIAGKFLGQMVGKNVRPAHN